VKKKKKYNPENLREIHFWIPKAISDDIKHFSKLMNITISQFCRKAIVEFLSKKKAEFIEKENK